MSKRKQITFDLDTKVLKQIFGEKKYTQAYKNIRDFMEDNGFKHIEGSVYVSSKGMSSVAVAETLDELKLKHPYLNKSVREIHQTDVGASHSLSNQFDYDGTPGKFKDKGKSQEQEQMQEKPSVFGEINKIKAEQNAQKDNSSPQIKPKSKDDISL